MIDVLRAQLEALKSQIDAMLAVIDSLQPSPASTTTDVASGQCPHAETENIGTFGAPEFRCLACRASVDMQ